ncbi:phosphoenolpyruvate synthase [Acrocarpospora pleiomorpha]|uniref:Phosphoenolpyruvate synthase n=1 Tax=Acrocarpospora pleiomorpha TaxID=90975 RepID=A0A5M3XU60_9ACTN|nr:PEP/pyruvate-binding domain-containing protein [Acrocarpospora pleiomorpha]GES24582.1 phosphoenolpyruvate synthase [Acrocarpospora pleiomorpha]
MSYILKFRDIGVEDLRLVGGKALNLGILTAAGLPIPPGVVVTTEAYDQVVGSLDLGSPELAADPAGARALVMGAAIPDDIAKAVRQFGDVPVAVRSSATAEDLPYASFAGQQDTYLNVIGGDAVLDAVHRCWASLWTDRAVAYRAANGIDHGVVRLAVVIQEMVQSEVAGVMFTANPVTGRRREAVIDASPGLGEAVVSGAVNPDHFVVRDGRILERRLGDKRMAVRSLAGGGVERVAAEHDAACLTDAQVLALAELGNRVEDHYGSPQDTEWAIDTDGTLWLTQARPITTLYPIPQGPPGLRAFFCFSLAQGLTRPITPMGISALRMLSASISATVFGSPVADPRAGAPAFHEAGGRIFVDLTPVLRSSLGRALVPRVFDVMEARSATVMRGLFGEPEFGVTQRSKRPAIRRGLRLARKFRVLPHAVQAIANPEKARRRVAQLGTDLKARLPLPPGVTPLDHAEWLLSTQMIPLVPSILPAAAPGFIMLGLAGKLLGAKAKPGELASVLRGLPHNVTTEMDLELWHLAERIRKHPEATALHDNPTRRDLPPLVREELDGFLTRYGDRTVAEIDLGLPRWREDPSHVIGVLANLLRLEDPSLAPDALFAKGAAEAETIIADLARRAGRLRGPLIRFALDRARALAGLRELPKYYLVVALATVRDLLWQVGADLAERGAIEKPDDIFFLTLPEAREGGDLRTTVTKRRDDYTRELRRRHIPRILLSDGTEPEAVARTTPAADGALTGTPASSGQVTGTARVVLDPIGAHLEPGEILVCPSTDPGWTPLFLTAAGLVMEMGGANSHGAVVAREYGIPAVVGVPHATESLKTGQRITVDGTSGTVTFA